MVDPSSANEYTDYCELDSWVEISSQPSSESLSSAGGDVATTGLRVPQDPRRRRRRSLRQNRPSNLNIQHRPFRVGGSSSQEEYEESESESDRVMTSSGEIPHHASHIIDAPDIGPTQPSSASDESAPPISDYDDDDEDRTAINYPITNDQCFTPQPNAFSHPPSSQSRNTSQPVPGSYFPAQRPRRYSSSRHSLPAPNDAHSSSHLPQNILSPSYNAAAHHEEALRASLTTLLSCAAAARALPKSETKASHTPAPKPQSNKVEPLSLRLVPESELPRNSPPQFQEPTFKPTIRRDSTSTSTSSERLKENKRKARNSSRERKSLKKARRTASTEDLQVSPTLLTWVVSAGVVVFLSALSFSAGYSLGKEAGKLEATSLSADGQLKSCAKEASRSGLGLKRSLARSAVQV